MIAYSVKLSNVVNVQLAINSWFIVYNVQVETPAMSKIFLQIDTPPSTL